MQVFLVRHGHSPFTGLSDHQRPLSALGQRQVTQAALFIKSVIQDESTQIICSDAVRTLSTAAIIDQQLLQSAVVADNLYYHARIGDWCDAITANQTFKVIILVGHNPTISFLSKYLNPQHQQNFRPACTAHYQLEIAEDGLKLPAQFIEFFTPNEQ